jgi:tripeptide aminopeptidase
MTMEKVHERFLKYVRYDTQSKEDAKTVPSTSGQAAFAQMLAKELEEIGANDVAVSDYSYVTASIPASRGMEAAPVLGLIAHMDTSPDSPGKGIRPRLIAPYDGKDIILNAEKNIVMRVCEFDDLERYAGQSLIVTDGTTLLGADDKAGVAEIMTAAERLIKEDMPHGKIRIAFTPDEEVGRGADHFDVAAFGAVYAYTVDGGAFGMIEYENFNAASAKVTVNGIGIHPGSAKDKMINAMSVAMAFNGLLPQNEQPRYTQGYEGFWHLCSMAGNVEQAQLSYIIRDHDAGLLERRKRAFSDAAEFLNKKYTDQTVSVCITDTYYI